MPAYVQSLEVCTGRAAHKPGPVRTARVYGPESVGPFVVLSSVMAASLLSTEWRSAIVILKPRAHLNATRRNTTQHNARQRTAPSRIQM